VTGELAGPAIGLEDLKQRLTTLAKGAIYDVRVSWQEPDDDGPATMPCPSCGTTVAVEHIATVEATGSKHTACAVCLEAPIVGFATGFRHYRLAEVAT
jgi:hypothetical protein